MGAKLYSQPGIFLRFGDVIHRSGLYTTKKSIFEKMWLCMVGDKILFGRKKYADDILLSPSSVNTSFDSISVTNFDLAI